MSDRIEKTIELKAPVSRVWRALTDHREFGTWFRVRWTGRSWSGRCRAGRSPIRASSTCAGRRWCRRWSPSGCSRSPGIPTRIDPNEDYSKEPPTLVEFTLQKTATGTLLRVVEFGLR